MAISELVPPAAQRHLRLFVDDGPNAAAAARRALTSLQPDLGDRLYADAALLISELVTNSVRHSHQDSGTAIALDLDLEDGELRVAVTDRGPGFDPDAHGPDYENGTGFGLHLLKSMARRWGVETNGATRVWFELGRPV